MAAVLERQVEELKNSNEKLASRNTLLEAKVLHLQYELMLALHRMWSRSSEKFQPQGPLLFDELAPQTPPVTEEPVGGQEVKKSTKNMTVNPL